MGSGVAGECNPGAASEAEFVVEEGHDFVAFVELQQSLDPFGLELGQLIMGIMHK